MSKIRYYGPLVAVVVGWFIMIVSTTLNFIFVIGDIISVVGLALFMKEELVSVLSGEEPDNSNLPISALIIAAMYVMGFVFSQQNKLSDVAIWFGLPIVIDILGWINISAISTYQSVIQKEQSINLDDITEANESWGRELLQKVAEITEGSVSDTQTKVLQLIRNLVEEEYQIRRRKKKDKSAKAEWIGE